MAANMNVNLDSLLDSTLDDLADMPEFKPFPAGAHRVSIKFEAKTVNEHPAVEMTLTGIATEELSNPEDTPIAAGDSTNLLFMLDNELGQGKFKEIMKVISGHFQAGTTRQNMEAANGAEVVVVTKVRQNKEKTQSYTDIVNIAVV